MKLSDFNTLLEDIGLPSEQELEAFKSVIAGKIKQLPDDDATAKTLKEIEELLQHVQAGGRMGMINGQLHAINDPAVMAAQKRLAQYIASMEVDPKDRAELFSMWRADKIVNIDKLLSKKSHTFSEIFNGYDTNPAIKELVDDVMEEQALGQGKGEFGLNVLSKSVSKPGGFVSNDDDEPGDQTTKGDLLMKYNGKWRKIEIKTTHGGAARFSDQEVRPAPGYEAAATALNTFVTRTHKPVAARLYPKGFPGYGMNLNKAIEFYQAVPPKSQAEFISLVNNAVTLIFGGKEANKPAVKRIVNAIKTGNANEAMQAYSQASFNYYMSKKDDEGVLAINLNSKNFMFYNQAEDLTKEKLRLDAKTVYISTVRDPGRGVYPQLQVVPTTFGARARAEAEAKAKAAAEKERAAWAKGKPEAPAVPTAKRPNPAAVQAFETAVNNFAKDLAARRGVTDRKTIAQISAVTRELATRGLDNNKIYTQLVKRFPELKVAKVAPATVQPSTEPTQPAVQSQEPVQESRQRRTPSAESKRQRR
jgi:hypothetical protein